MQAPFQGMKSSLFCRNAFNLMLVNILLLGNLSLAVSFMQPFTLHGKTVHAAAFESVATPAKNTMTSRQKIHGRQNMSTAPHLSNKTNQKRSEANTSMLVPLDATVVAVATTTIAFTVLATATPTPTPTATPTPTPTPTPIPTVVTTPLPDVGISETYAGNGMLQQGQTVTYVLHVSSTSLSGPIGPSQFVKVKTIIPIGLGNVAAAGSNWTIITSSTTSTVLIAATYRGTYPISPGTTLTPIIITGTILTNSNLAITSTSVVGVSGDANPDNNVATTTIFLITAPSAQNIPAVRKRQIKASREASDALIRLIAT
jgi:hypothetical protein